MRRSIHINGMAMGIWVANKKSSKVERPLYATFQHQKLNRLGHDFPTADWDYLGATVLNRIWRFGPVALPVCGGVLEFLCLINS